MIRFPGFSRRLLLSPDPPESSGAPPAPPDNSGAPTPAAPPAASAVTRSEAREEDAAEIVALRRKLAEEGELRKRDQMRLAELEDENRRLKNPTPPRREIAERQKRGFLDDVENFLADR